jgi:hypothetical protein
VGYYNACIEKCLTIVRYPYISLIDDRVRQNTVMNLYVPQKWPIYHPAEQLASSQERLNTSSQILSQKSLEGQLLAMAVHL